MLNIQLQKGDSYTDIAPQANTPYKSPGGQPSIRLLPGDSWYSPGGAFRLTLQAWDTNLVWQVVDDSHLPPWTQGQALNPAAMNWLPVWSPHIEGKSVTEVDMQVDGNLVAYAGSAAVWSTSTNGNEHAFLRLQDDGNVVIYNTSGAAVFQSNTSATEAGGFNG
jgi:hypothetical protein